LIEAPSDHLTREDLTDIASALASDGETFIVGGQALNLWAERYSETFVELSDYGPYTSKDVDYFGHREAGAVGAAPSSARAVQLAR
jgi:hypothetical protein